MRNFISKEDLNLLMMYDEIDEVLDAVSKWYTRHALNGKRAIPD
jgi:hypothetical protein